MEPTFDLVGRLRARRLKWLGQLLRHENEGLLVRTVVMVQCEQALCLGQQAGTIFMDAPVYESVGELVAAATDKVEWAKLVKALLPHTKDTITQSQEGVLRYE